MKIDSIRTASFIVSTILVFLILGIAMRNRFVISSEMSSMVNEAQTVRVLAPFLLTHRVLEFLGVAMVVLAAVSCCSAMLRRERGDVG